MRPLPIGRTALDEQAALTSSQVLIAGVSLGEVELETRIWKRSPPSRRRRSSWWFAIIHVGIFARFTINTDMIMPFVSKSGLAPLWLIMRWVRETSTQDRLLSTQNVVRTRTLPPGTSIIWFLYMTWNTRQSHNLLLLALRASLHRRSSAVHLAHWKSSL